jgi:sortase A
LGLTALAWGAITWRWGDPVTGLYTKRVQSRLEDELAAKRRTFLDGALAAVPAASPESDVVPRAVRRLAARYRPTLREGAAAGQLVVPRLNLDVIVVLGTETNTLRKGPGIHRSTLLPGQGGLIYVAGHRTTYAAPFAHLDTLRPGDTATMEMPYGTFRYRVTGTRIVDDRDLSVLRPTRAEVLRLQACHPRFRATQRLVVSAQLVGVSPASASAG